MSLIFKRIENGIFNGLLTRLRNVSILLVYVAELYTRPAYIIRAYRDLSGLAGLY
jgi:hypothetical protein